MNIIGRLTRDAEIRTTANDKKLISFTVAENDSYKSKEGEWVQLTTFFDCAYWISTNVAKILTKGTVVELTGRVAARAWNDADGNPRAGLNFNTSQIKVHAGGKRSEETELDDKPAAAKSKPSKISKQTEDHDLPF